MSAACTVAALAFSPIHNITTKSLSVAPPGEVQGGLLSRLVSKITSLIGRNKKTPVKAVQETAEESEDDKEKED